MPLLVVINRGEEEEERNRECMWEGGRGFARFQDQGMVHSLDPHVFLGSGHPSEAFDTEERRESAG